MAKWTAATRAAYFKEHPENFADPEHQAYPIKDASDVRDAARLAGHAADPEKVRRRIIAIAKRLGLADALPDSWKQDMNNDSPPSQASQEERAAALSSLPAAIQFYVPIERIDRERREVIGTATAEVEDGHGTIFRYEASKDAFLRWRGNIREMHDPHKAVGRALEIIPDDANKRILVRARISAGAEDTWQKILDGTLTGFSVGGKNGKWSETEIEGRRVPILERYDLVELSLVDNPSCPVANIELVRSDGLASNVLADDLEPEPEPGAPLPATASETETEIARIGARLSAQTISDLHDARNHQIMGAIHLMKVCGCDECQAGCAALDPDDDGDIDYAGLYDPDEDAGSGSPAENEEEEARHQIETLRAVLSEEIQRQLAPAIRRVNALLARDAATTPPSSAPTPAVPPVDLAPVRQQLAEIRSLVERIAAQPVSSSGPVLHSQSVPAEKLLATSAPRHLDDASAIERALELGFSPPSDLDAQIKAAASLIRR